MAALERHPDKLANRTVMLIAGTGGIGLGVANALLARGAKVILTSTNAEKLDRKMKELRQVYPELTESHITGYILNLGSPEVEDNIKVVVEALRQAKVEKIDHLAYFAGDSLPTFQLEDIKLDSWLKATQVRTISAILCIKHLLPFLKAAGPASATFSSSITLTGGSVSDKPIPGGWTLVAMAAAALNGAARQLALDLKPIRVNTVAPGLVDTDLWRDLSAEQKAAFLKDAEGKMPTGRVGDVRDVAESYLYFMNDGNITGEVMRTNSGVLLV